MTGELPSCCIVLQTPRALGQQLCTCGLRHTEGHHALFSMTLVVWPRGFPMLVAFDRQQSIRLFDPNTPGTSALVCDGRHEGGHDVFRYKFTYKFSHHEGGHDFFVQVVDVENIHHF